MRLIDADALIESIEHNKGKNSIYAQYVRAYTKGEPTIDAMPVFHGRWMDMKGFWMCSGCHKDTLNLFNYCPYCGAKMDKEE